MRLFGVKILIYGLSVVFFSGCSILNNWQQLMLLKQTGDNRRHAEQYLKKQEKLFYLLLNDTVNNTLKEGMPKRNILNTYGEPVLYRNIADNADEAGVVEELLYRHPTQYFSSERVYMYFDNAGKLARWEYYPSQ